MKIAVMGTRGIPARYGGFETFAEELSARLAQRGHQVTVYCLKSSTLEGNGSHRGVRRVVLPGFGAEHIELLSHTGLATLHAAFQRYDAVLVCNALNAVFTCLPRLLARRVVINVDGMAGQRHNWGTLGQLAWDISERLAAKIPDRLITDAAGVCEYFEERYGVKSVVIPYGAPKVSVPPGGTLMKYNLHAREYLLFVSRLDPENHAHTVISAYKKAHIPAPLVLVGDIAETTRYVGHLREQTSNWEVLSEAKIVLAGTVYGRPIEELMGNALAYIQATEVGGTHPALLQAMGAGSLVIANDLPEHREVLADAGVYYRYNSITDLAQKMRDVFQNPSQFDGFRAKAQSRIESSYSWELITDRYEELFRSLLNGR